MHKKIKFLFKFKFLDLIFFFFFFPGPGGDSRKTPRSPAEIFPKWPLYDKSEVEIDFFQAFDKVVAHQTKRLF